MKSLTKYPRTRHLQGSRLQPGDHDLSAVPFSELAGCRLVVEEKLDGANAAFSFDGSGKLYLQSRGHFLTGGSRERHFDLFKTWAACHQGVLFEALGPGVVVYGEWLFAKHTVFYDRLPHYFMEFDILDTGTGVFLSTERRRELLAGLPVRSVPVLYRGADWTPETIPTMVRPSLYKSDRWRDTLSQVTRGEGLDVTQVGRETDPEDLAEGLYIKHEQGGEVVGRYKWVRHSFLTAVVESESHWLCRPIVPNQLAPGVDIYGGSP